MTGRNPAAGFAARPGAADRWIKAAEPVPSPPSDDFAARLTIDVTPETRRRLKRAALDRGTTLADLVRALIDRELAGESE
jgi:hypothetical protein